MRFSEKYKDEIKSIKIQKYDMDSRLRRDIWNMLYKWISFHNEKYGVAISLTADRDAIFRGIWQYKALFLDELPLSKEGFQSFLKDWILFDPYYCIYDLLEMINDFELTDHKVWVTSMQFQENVNFILEKNNSGWKFVKSQIYPIEYIDIPKTLEESKALKTNPPILKRLSNSDSSKSSPAIVPDEEEGPFLW